jgi:hypothetical protein
MPGQPPSAGCEHTASDLVSNSTRGVLAEFIVARALGLDTGVRTEWQAFDLETASGKKIEVKSRPTRTGRGTMSFGSEP